MLRRVKRRSLRSAGRRPRIETGRRIAQQQWRLIDARFEYAGTVLPRENDFGACPGCSFYSSNGDVRPACRPSWAFDPGAPRETRATTCPRSKNGVLSNLGKFTPEVRRLSADRFSSSIRIAAPGGYGAGDSRREVGRWPLRPRSLPAPTAKTSGHEEASGYLGTSNRRSQPGTGSKKKQPSKERQAPTEGLGSRAAERPGSTE